ncbi:cupin domain-containing protein [Marinicella sp. W31]|uniref:cupin domain-containing protein n=1 Tax=Marinicella sp. W31 TaxID=3023713 RepID=UPI00375800E2
MSKNNNLQPIRFTDKLNLFSEHWSPKVIAEMNDYQFKLAKLEGEFVWHQHDDTDEVFVILEGELEIEFKEKTVHLESGQMLVVPRGVSHRPVARKECHILLIEPRGVVNTGEVESGLTATQDVWI